LVKNPQSPYEKVPFPELFEVRSVFRYLDIGEDIVVGFSPFLFMVGLLSMETKEMD
jgi:hypothetical protein